MLCKKWATAYRSRCRYAVLLIVLNSKMSGWIDNRHHPVDEIDRPGTFDAGGAFKGGSMGSRRECDPLPSCHSRFNCKAVQPGH